MNFYFDCYLVIPDMDRTQMLLVQDDQNWRLPHFAFTEDHFGIVDYINRAALEYLGLSVTVLRCLSYDCWPDHIAAIYLMEIHTQAEPTQGQWIDCGEVEALPLRPAEQKQFLNACFAESRQGELYSPAYTRPGWYASTVTWVQENLGKVGRQLVGPIEQLRLWQRCCLLRVPTDQGFTYLKTVAGPFAHEPALTHELFHRFPKFIPQVLAIDAERGLLLTADFSRGTLDGAVDVAVWTQAMRQYAALQIACSNQEEQWLSVGCPDRRLDVLAKQITPLFADTAPILRDLPDGLSEEQITMLQALEPSFRNACSHLASLGLPATLSHGDLCAGNVAVTASGALFFDWSDASLSHPFFDLHWLLHGLEYRFPEQADIREQLRDAYLEPWEVFVPMVRLQAAFALSRPLAALHHALTYVRYILPYVEADWEMTELVPFFLRLSL